MPPIICMQIIIIIIIIIIIPGLGAVKVARE
jgi:hypothetical protein